jgi:sterol desaturase/sphingolipid hydroxylase (fatty acid hydroxylase superfamily)
MKKSLAILLIFTLLSLSSYVIGVYALAVIVGHFPALSPFVFVDTHGSSEFSLGSAVLQPGGFLAVIAVCLTFEAMCLGLDRSALKRLLDGGSASTRVDLFYTVLRIAGGLNLLIFVFSFGTLFWFVNQIHRVLHIGFLQHIHSIVLQFGVVYLVNTFVAYWGHRLMHTRLLWEIHKVHHAAEEMNIVTPFRNHPIELVVMTVLNAFPVAVLGASPLVIITYYAVNMVYQSLVHSEINLKGKLWDMIWITPAAHRIHHSNRADHWDRNFGIVTLWDYLFGTYFIPSSEKLTYGVEGGDNYNRSAHVLELFDNVRRWLRPAWTRGQVPAEQQPSMPVSNLLHHPSNPIRDVMQNPGGNEEIPGESDNFDHPVME